MGRPAGGSRNSLRTGGGDGCGTDGLGRGAGKGSAGDGDRPDIHEPRPVGFRQSPRHDRPQPDTAGRLGPRRGPGTGRGAGGQSGFFGRVDPLAGVDLGGSVGGAGLLLICHGRVGPGDHRRRQPAGPAIGRDAGLLFDVPIGPSGHRDRASGWAPFGGPDFSSR